MPPTYLLTDNPRSVTIDQIAGVPVRHRDIVAAARHYGCAVRTCEPFDPESKGGAEHTVKIAKADLVPTSANLRLAYDSFAELEAACQQWCERINARRHRATGQLRSSGSRWSGRDCMCLPDNPHLLALGEERLVGSDQKISWGAVRYSTPDGHQGRRVWCRVCGEELVIIARTGGALAEIARHRLSTPGNPRILDAHYPHHLQSGSGLRMSKPRPRAEAEIEFLMLGEGAQQWLTAAAATGVARNRRKMNQAVELARVLGADRVDRALAVAARAGRFDDGDLVSILDHIGRDGSRPAKVVTIDGTHSAQPGTGPWRRLGA